MSRPTRRQFLKSTLAAAATITIAGTKSSGRVLGANDTIRLGVAGIHGRGSAHISAFAGMKGVQVTYLIDPDIRTHAMRIDQVNKKGKNKPEAIQDIRKALDDKNLDAVSVATPNHWHALITIWACQAGKDVYVEKPCSHNIHEGRIAVETARKYNRIVQHGTQSRSTGTWAKLAAIVRSGQLGKLLMSRGLCYKPRATIGVKTPTTPPAELDFNLWLGPAAERPYHTNLVHYNWHWFWDFGNGDIGNQGVHEMDKARWMIPGATLPKSVLSLGGRFGYTDQGETPNTMMTVFDYGETQLVFEVRGLKTDKLRGVKIGNMVHLEGGIIASENKGDDDKLTFYPKGSDQPAPLPKIEVDVKRGPGDGHFGNFIAAVRSRQRADLNADILEGHYSAALCHLANMSYRMGAPVPFNPQTRAFGDDKAAYETLARMEEHLAQGNGLKLDGTTYQLGRKLVVDDKEERIINEPEANKLLSRHYRQPFAVPEKVV